MCVPEVLGEDGDGSTAIRSPSGHGRWPLANLSSSFEGGPRPTLRHPGTSSADHCSASTPAAKSSEPRTAPPASAGLAEISGQGSLPNRSRRTRGTPTEGPELCLGGRAWEDARGEPSQHSG